jgi:hypothetical protein
MHSVIKVALVVGLIAYSLAAMISCERSQNPAPISGYFLTLSAVPDSIPRSGSGSTSIIHALVRTLADSTQTGGLHLEFSASRGNITSDAVSSASDTTGIDPNYHYVYFSCQTCPDTIAVVKIQASAFENGDFVDMDTTSVVVYVP